LVVYLLRHQHTGIFTYTCMKHKTAVYILLLFLPVLLLARGSFAQAKAKKDTLFFNNGEILIGELKQITYGKATFDSDAIGLITIKMYKIRSAHTTIGTLRVETTTNQKLYGKLEPTKSRDTVYVADGVNRIKVPLNQINSVIAFRRGFFDQLDGNVSAGFSFSHSSSIGQVNLNADIKYTTRWLETELTVSTLSSIDSSHYIRDQETEQLSFYHYIKSSDWFAAAAVSHQRNEELSLAYRYQGILGGGNKFLTGETINALALTGFAFSEEKSINGNSTGGTELEIPLILQIDFFKFTHPNMQITMNNAGYVSITQAGRYRYDGNVTFAWELIKDFSLTINLYGNYDSKPLDLGSSKIDYGLVMGLAYKF